MPRHVDALVSPTLKNLRERWWDSDFSDFLREMLRPRPGHRILDVGCGEGTAEISLGRLQVSQVSLFAIDKRLDRAAKTASIGTKHNIKVHVAAADAMALPFREACFDSTFCVGVLQHVRDVRQAVGELARVTKVGGRVVAVEPDNAARYWFSSLPSGRQAYEVGMRFFAAAGLARGDAFEASVGPKLPGLLAESGLDPLWVSLYPVSVTRMGTPPKAVWEGRRSAVQKILRRSSGDEVESLATEYLEQLDRYAAAADAAGKRFVEIQNTMLFATVGEKADAQ
jgi:SAM-dependent methyltransferase